MCGTITAAAAFSVWSRHLCWANSHTKSVRHQVVSKYKTKPNICTSVVVTTLLVLALIQVYGYGPGISEPGTGSRLQLKGRV